MWKWQADRKGKMILETERLFLREMNMELKTAVNPAIRMRSVMTMAAPICSAKAARTAEKTGIFPIQGLVSKAENRCL